MPRAMTPSERMMMISRQARRGRGQSEVTQKRGRFVLRLPRPLLAESETKTTQTDHNDEHTLQPQGKYVNREKQCHASTKEHHSQLPSHQLCLTPQRCGSAPGSGVSSNRGEASISGRAGSNSGVGVAATATR